MRRITIFKENFWKSIKQSLIKPSINIPLAVLIDKFAVDVTLKFHA